LKRDTIAVLIVVMALIADIALTPFPRHLALHVVIAVLFLLSLVIPVRLDLSRRYFYIIAFFLIVPFILWIYFFTDPSPTSRIYSLHYLAGIYFLALLLLMAFKKRKDDDLLLILSFIFIVMIAAGYRDYRMRSELYKLCVAFQTLLVIVFSMLHEHPLKKEERFRGSEYWKRLAVIVTIFLVLSYSIAKFFVWTETKVNAIFNLTLDSMAFSPAFSSKTDLDAVESLKGSSRVILRIFSTTQPSYLVGKVFQTYSNRSWESKRSSRIVYPAREAVAEKVSRHFPEGEGSVFSLTRGAEDPAEADKARVFQTYYITALNTETLFAPRGALFAMLTSENLRIDEPGVIYTTLKGTRGEYRLACRPGEVVKGDESPENLSIYLEPPPLSDKIRKLNSELVKKGDSPWTIAQSLTDYFHKNFTYGVGPSAVGGSDILEEFLLSTRQGHCEYFATAMTLLLRLNNIPARYINGFLVEEYNRMGGYYFVREKDAHAWVEAYIPDKGWITFDPTPPRQGRREDKSLIPVFIREFYDMVKLKLHNVVSRIMAGDIKGIFVFIILQIRDVVLWIVATPFRFTITVLLLISIVVLTMKRKTLFIKDKNCNNNRKPRLQLSPKVCELMKLASECEKVLARKKLKRHLSDSLLELSRQAGSLSLDAKSLALVQEFINEYCTLRFGRDEIKDEDILRMKEKLQVIKSTVR